MNKNLYFFPLLIVAAYISSCNLNTSKTDDFDVSKYSDEDFDHLGITNRDSLSAASKRALKWPHIGNEWFIEFQVSDLKGDFDGHKVHDPCILPYRGKYYLYYKGEQMGEEITLADAR